MTFRELSLLSAEESLVAGCLDHEHCLLPAARELGLQPFRSHKGATLQAIYAWCIDAYLGGYYDEDDNRDRLADTLADAGERWYVTDYLFDGNTAVAAYSAALVAALRQTYEAQDRAIAAAQALTNTPITISAPVTPPPPAPLSRIGWRPERGGHRGGITI